MTKTCIVIMGATAVGKTAVGIELAKHFGTAIISADSRQCYRELNTGVAKPSPEELHSVHHYFINSHSIHEQVNAGIFEKYALEKVQEIFATNNTAILVGGTGLYIQTFCDGMDDVPVVLPGLREKIVADYQLQGLKWLQQEVEKHDPVFFSSGEIQNPHRLMRALEVKLSAGNSIVHFQRRQKTMRDFNIIKIGLELPKDLLYRRINERVDTMIINGLAAEVQQLEPWKHLNALQTVGYRELFDYYAGKISMELAITAIKINTRHYARRQMTWFKKDNAVKWCMPDFITVLDLVSKNFTGNN